MTPNPSAAPDAATAEVNPAAVVDKAPPWSFLRYFLSGSTLVLVLFGGLFFADYEWANEAVRVREQSNVEMMDAIVRQDMETVLGDIVYLSGSASRLYDRPTAVGELPQTLPWLLLNFARAKRIYGSVAFVDPGGKEAIRIDLDEGGATVADPVGLRDLSHVSYIPDAGALQPNEVVISDFHGRVPITDDDGDERYSIAVGKAVYDGNGQLRGQIVLDYRAKAILDRLRRVEQQVHSRAILLNADGAWIYGGTAEDGKSLDFPMSFAQQRSDMWAQLKEVKQGQIQRGNRLSTFATIRPLYGIGQLAERTGVTLVHGTRRRDPDAYHWKLLTEADVRPSHLVPLLGDPRVYVLLAAVLVGVGLGEPPVRGIRGEASSGDRGAASQAGGTATRLGPRKGGQHDPEEFHLDHFPRISFAAGDHRQQRSDAGASGRRRARAGGGAPGIDPRGGHTHQRPDRPDPVCRKGRERSADSASPAVRHRRTDC